MACGICAVRPSGARNSLQPSSARNSLQPSIPFLQTSTSLSRPAYCRFCASGGLIRQVAQSRTSLFSWEYRDAVRSAEFIFFQLFLKKPLPCLCARTPFLVLSSLYDFFILFYFILFCFILFYFVLFCFILFYFFFLFSFFLFPFSFLFFLFLFPFSFFLFLPLSFFLFPFPFSLFPFSFFLFPFSFFLFLLFFFFFSWAQHNPYRDSD